MSITGRQGSNTEGTPENPFGSTGIELFARVVNDPEPTPGLYNFSGWAAARGSGNWCSPIFQMFSTEGQAPLLNHSGLASGTAQVTISVTVTKPNFRPLTETAVFVVEADPGGCGGGGGGGNSGPFSVSVSPGATSVPLGSTITLVGRGSDASDNTLTFRFYASTIQGQRGTLIGVRQASGCNNGCTASFSLSAGVIPRTRYFQVEASDGTNSTFSTQRSVTVISNNTPPPTADAPSVCNCPEGGQVSVNAGPAMVNLVGGESLTLNGDAGGPATGGAVVPGSFQWSIINNGGINSGLSLTSTNSLMTSLVTPDVSVDRNVELRLTASFGNCSCSDDIEVDVLADAPPEADLELVSLADSADPVTTNSNVTYTALARNNGPAQAQDVTLTFLVPSGSFQSGSNGCALAPSSTTEVNCNLGNMSNGATSSREVTISAGASGQVQVTASVLSTSATETNFGNNVLDETTQVAQVTTDLSISKVADSQAVSVNGTASYNITVTNQGPENASNVTVVDTLPGGLSFLSASSTQGTCGHNAGVVTCVLGALDNGDSAGITLTATATQASPNVVNTATVSANEADSNGANNQSQATIAVTDSEADLVIELDSVQPSPVGQDKNVQVTMIVRNDGPDDAPGVVVESVIPEGLNFLSAEADQGTCVNNAGTVSCALGTLEDAEITLVSFTMQAVGDALVSQIVDVDSGALDPDETNNSAQADVRILGPNFLAIPHTVSADTFIGLGVVNSVGDSNSLSIEGRDSDGNVVSQIDRDQEIAALGQDAFLTRDLPASDTLIMRGNQGPFQAFFMIGDNNAPPRKLDGVGSEPQDDTELFLPRIRQIGQDFTRIYLFNPDFEAVTNVEMRLFDQDGIELGSADFVLQPQGSILATADELFGVTDVEDGYVRIEASLPVRGFELVKVDDNFATMMAQSRLITQELVSPHFFIGANDQGTRLRFVNANDQAARVTVRAYDNDSELIGEAPFDIPPSSVAIHQLADLMDIDTSELDQFTVVQGFLEFDLNGGTAGPFLQEANVVPIISYDGVDKETLSSLPIPVEGETDTLFLHVAQNRDIFTGLAIFNPGDDAATVTIEAFDRSGDRSALRNRALGPRSRVVGLVNGSLFFGGS
ncbi:MAG TPA: hypothetical protein VLV83_20020, partial [Acidobacteriota bacterium]|nr:hypothetical protein [Acidobacteriota bacterium]